MNYKLIFILILSFLFGCAGNPTKNTVITKTYPMVDDEVKSYVIKFNEYYSQYRHSTLNNDVIVRYTTIPHSKKALGVYYRIHDFVIINSKSWNRLDKYQKEIVVFHELGHYILKRGHDWSNKRILKNGCSRSMMYYRGVSSKCYQKRREYYLKELFLWSQ